MVILLLLFYERLLKYQSFRALQMNVSTLIFMLNELMY